MSSANWEIRFSNSRQLPYFYNASTGTSTWERPDDVPEDEVASLPGAQYLQIGNSGAPDKVRASHLLVKHRDSRRPSSWKEVSFDIVFFFCVGLTSSLFKRATSLDPSRRLSRSFAPTHKLWAASRRAMNSLLWPKFTATVRQLPKAAISVTLDGDRCKSLSKTLPSAYRLAR